MSQMSRHQCLVYEGSPSGHLPALVRAIRDKLKDNYRCLYLNSPPMVAGVRSYLFAGGIDVPKEIMKGSLVLSSEQGHLKNGRFDIDRMLEMLSGAVNQALNEGYRGLLGTGDMSWEFGPEKDFSKLVEYERRLEDLFQEHPTLFGICQYHTDTLPPETAQAGVLTHKSFFLNETLSRLSSHHFPAELTTPSSI
jgi:MEDS: MEthanogen/methylotroph, DcmR Sensory domain